MNILYLQSELMGYHIPILKKYVKKYDDKVLVVYWDKKKLTPFIPPILDQIKYYKKSDYNRKTLLYLVENIKPDIIRISGWMDKEYLFICKIMKRRGVKVVVSSDSQLKNTLRQNLGRYYFRLFMHKYFNHVWVAGPYQYGYARRLDFEKEKIIFNCFSADIELLGSYFVVGKQTQNHNFIFLGRFEEVKGVLILLKAWDKITNKKDWTLTFIGSGSLKEEIASHENIEVKDFMQPEDLAIEIQKYNFLILPSLKEPWALVIHEAMSADIPVLATNICGSAPKFIIPSFTGYTCLPNNVDSLIESISKVLRMDDDQLSKMSRNAYSRFKVITPEIAAASCLSIYK